MRRLSKARINVLQNLIITLLSVSALTLFLVLQLNFRPETLFSALFPGEDAHTGAAGGTAESLSALPSAVRLAVSGDYGRHGSIHLTTADDVFAGAGNLLQEALGSSGILTAGTESEFLAALGGDSLYCDWATALPLSVSGGILGASVSDAPFDVRRMALAADDDTVSLYLTDDERYLCCTTKVSADSLRDFIESCQLPGVSFAWELDGAAADPYTLLPTGEQETYPRLTSRPAAQPANVLLSSLGFNPNTNSRYTESNGTEVIRDGSRTLRVETDGSLLYDGGGSPVSELSLANDDVPVTAVEAALGSFRLINGLLAGSEAQLCLRSVEATETGWLVTFDYQKDGVLIRFSSGETAAQAEISGGNITRFSVCLRSYTSTETPSLLLPLRQALAVAAGTSGEMNICYVDSGSTADAAWLMD